MKYARPGANLYGRVCVCVCFHWALKKLPSREATGQEEASCKPACPLASARMSG